MSDIELAVTRTKELEALLESALGATGKGLHEKVTSVQTRLSPQLVKKLRFIATIRNKIVHDTAYTRIDDRAGFEKACDEAISELRRTFAPPKVINKGCFGLVLIVACAIAVVL